MSLTSRRDHDGWVVGDEPAVVVDFQGMFDYATGSAKEKT
jgi:hypothetical protein